MQVSVELVEKPKHEQVVIRCYTVDARVDSIARYIKALDGSLHGYTEDAMHQVFLQDIYYVEAVDNRLFACTVHKVYEVKMKLYEFEALYRGVSFFRCSKSMLVNLMKIKNVYPILNGRLAAKLYNQEEIIISRQYARDLKKLFSGGNQCVYGHL